jgi:hypothetical protein
MIMNNTAPEGFGSTYLNPKIESYSDLVYRTKSLLGWPSAPVEITDAQWGHIIDKAVEDFTEFEGNREEEYLVFCANSYKRSCGVKLDDLLDVGCNPQHCYTTTVYETVTSTRQECDFIQTTTAYLSTTPFLYPTRFDVSNPNSVAFSGVSGQHMFLYFDSENPWDAQNVCAANCVTINPVNSRWYLLSSNPNLSATNFNFVQSPILSGVLSSVSYNVTAHGFYQVPMSALGSSVSAIPISYFPLSAFYPKNYLLGPTVSACIDIGFGSGYIYPNCSTSNISSCAPLSAQYGAFPPTTAIWAASALDFSNATHVKLLGVPSCTTDGSIPLNSHDGILGTFTLCNTAFSTNGPMSLNRVQFMNDYKPPVEALYNMNCNWKNNGFTFSKYISSNGECVRTTPEKVLVDVTFNNCTTVTQIGTVSSSVSSNIDGFINRKRKVLGVFTADTTSQGGYFGGGGDLLFNFDYALMANTFGFDLMGSRNSLGKQGYDLLTYHMARSFVEHSKKMLRYVSYQFNPKTQYLKMTPEPAYPGATNYAGDCCDGPVIGSNSQCYIVGVYLEPPVEHLLSSYFIKEYVLALAMITLGRIRNTFGGVTLYGGATLTGQDLIAKGEEKAKELLAELRDQLRYSAPPMFFVA